MRWLAGDDLLDHRAYLRGFGPTISKAKSQRTNQLAIRVERLHLEAGDATLGQARSIVTDRPLLRGIAYRQPPQYSQIYILS